MKKTKKQLLLSSVSLLLCFSMLLGSTFAWFTDSAISENNIIQTGNLDVEMYWADTLLPADSSAWQKADDTPIFTYDNWEPGYTDVKYVKISNKGNLALQWKLNIVAQGEVTALADVIDVYYINPVSEAVTTLTGKTSNGVLSDVIANNVTTNGVLLPAGEANDNYIVGETIIAIALHMDENAGNDYQDKSIGDGFNVNLIATQFSYESDGFGTPDYDAGAQWPDNIVADNKATAPVTSVNGLVADALSLISDDGAINANIPTGVKLEDGATSLTLAISNVEDSKANVSLNENEASLSIDVHVYGVAADNDVVMAIGIKELLPVGLNMGNYRFYHVEGGETVAMTLLENGATPVHNNYEYDPATGDVVLYLKSFSEVKLIANKESKWTGGLDFSWYDADATELTIANADQLAALSAIVGGMLGQTADSFAGKTIKLLTNINLGDKESENNENIIFYPIGYYNSDGTYAKTGTAITSGFKNFEGTFDGNGHTIANFYQNTWEMKGDHNWYAPEDQHYRDGMGLFGRVYGGTVKNLVIKNFSSDGEIATTGTIAAYADFGATFENIAIFNCNPRVYNIGNGGIVGCVGWYTKDVTETPVTFKNITVDNSNKISALWGSYDVACGGIVGQYYPTSGQSSADYPVNAGIYMENCHVSAQMDVYNDVCANYQYYAYRYAGILIGSVRENVTIDGRVYPKMDGITAKDCTVHFGTWNDYYYCELVDNTTASYTHDHQMSRLVEIKAINGTTITYLDGSTGTVPSTGRANYVIVDYTKGHGTENAECYHFLNGEVWTHDMAGTETVNGQTVLKEDKQHLYLEFNNLVTGYGWGVTSKGVEDMEGVSILDREVGDSVEKFEGKVTTLLDNKVYTLGEIFNLIDTGVQLVPGALTVTLVSVDDNNPVTGTFVRDVDNWANGTIKLEGTGRIQIIIQDYYFCTPTVIEVEVTCNHAGGTATCYEQATCDRCGQFYGETIAHNFGSATCQSSAKCTVCGVANGNPTAHNYTAATCQTPATCTVCGVTTGGVNSSNHVSSTYTWVYVNETYCYQRCGCGTTITGNSGHAWNNDRCTRCNKVQNLITLANGSNTYPSGQLADIKITFNSANAENAASTYGIYLYQGQTQVMAYMANNTSVTGFKYGTNIIDQNGAYNHLPAGVYTIRVINMNTNAIVAVKTIKLVGTGTQYWSASDLYNNATTSGSKSMNGDWVRFTNTADGGCNGEGELRIIVDANESGASWSGGYLIMKYRKNTWLNAMDILLGNGSAYPETTVWLDGSTSNCTEFIYRCGTNAGASYGLILDLFDNRIANGQYIEIEYIAFYTDWTMADHTSHTANAAVTENYVAPTCTTAGKYDSVVYCDVCNGEMSRTTVTVAATGHNYTAATCTSAAKCTTCGVVSGTNAAHNFTAATCTTPSKCTVCGLIGSVITGHSWIAATCTTPKTCSVCRVTEGPALGHRVGATVVENNKLPTCAQNGSYDNVVYCANGCGHEISRTAITVPATGVHNYATIVDQKAVTCTTDGYVIRACGCGAQETTTITATGHNEVVDAAVKATCTTAGKTEGYHCSTCNEILVAQTEIPALDHSFKAATCEAPKTCSACGAIEGDALGHNYVNGVCSNCGATNPAPPVETPEDTPVTRTEHSPYEYFDCCSQGYVSYKDALNIAGEFHLDAIGSTAIGSSFKQGMSITIADGGVYQMTAWFGINTTNYTLGWNMGSDDTRTWSLEAHLITATNAGQNADWTAVFAAANAAGYDYAVRITYSFPSYVVAAGETIHLWAEDNETGIRHCFGEFKLSKPGNETHFGSVNLDVIKPSGSYPSYTKTATTVTIPAADLTLGRDFALSGWVASNITDKNDANIANNYNIIVRVNGQSYTVPFKNRTSELVNAGVLNNWTGYVAFEGTFKLNNVKNGDTLYLILVRKGTSAVYSGEDEEFVFASYTLNITDSTANYTLLNTVSKNDPVKDKETVTAPNDDANLKMWFDHLTQKVSRYDTSNKNSTNSSYTIQMGRNEMEGCHFYLYHPENKKITIKISDFINEYGETLETELGVEFYIEEGYLPLKGFTEGQTSAAGNVVGVYPDAVVPYESYIKNGFGGDEGGSYEYGTWVPIGPYTYKGVTREAIRGFTIQATTLRTSRPGQYSATVEIYDAETGECIKMANVYTYVYDVILSDETALDTYIGVWNENYIQTYQKFGGYNDADVTRALANFMLDYRMTPSMGGWATENVLGVEWLYNPRVTTIRVYDQATYEKYKNDPILAEKMVYYGQDEPGAPREQYRPLTLEDGTKVSYYDQFGVLAMLGVAEEAKMLQSWGWDDYRLLIPFERNADFTDFSTYPNLMQDGVIPGMSWAAIEAALQEEGAKELYNKYKTELQSSEDMVDFLSEYISLWVYTYTGSTPRALNSTSGCRYMQSVAHDTVYGEYEERMRKYKAEGDEIWGYVACEPQWHSPYQNILLFNDGTEARTMFWTSYKLGQTGWLYWREDHYGAANTNTYAMRAPFSATGPGDGILVYPGAIYGQVDPIPSIRFMNMRDGIEDYELLCMLEEKYGEAKAMEMVENIVTSTVTFTRDDDKVYNVHAEILRLLEAAN